uniref:Putative secreted protein n=1 Tax=Anopheles darlingi TaxID=43151 RepID=A0A2M4DL23_ANODA
MPAPRVPIPRHPQQSSSFFFVFFLLLFLASRRCRPPHPGTTGVTSTLIQGKQKRASVCPNLDKVVQPPASYQLRVANRFKPSSSSSPAAAAEV